jgi:hypothetical protein
MYWFSQINQVYQLIHKLPITLYKHLFMANQYPSVLPVQRMLNETE